MSRTALRVSSSRRRASSLAVARVLVAGWVLASAGPGHAVDAADTEPPRVVAFDMTPTVVDITHESAEVTLTMRVTDATAVAYAQTALVIDDSAATTGVVSHSTGEQPLTAGSAQDGIYTATIGLPRRFTAVGTYTVEVHLSDSVGNTAISALPATLATTLTVTAVGAAAPDAPHSVVARAGSTPTLNLPQGVGSGAAYVSWRSGDDNASPITGGTVTADPGGQTCTAQGHTDCVVTGLTNGTSYTFTVTETNALGVSPPSAPSTPVVPAAIAPTAPWQVIAEARDGAVELSWNPADGNRLPISRYTVTSIPGGVAAEVPGDTRTARVTGLAPRIAYTFTVAATNDAGTGEASEPSNDVMPSGVSTWTATSQPTARSLAGGCPDGQLPPHPFSDVLAGGAHEQAIACVAWWRVASGRNPTSYAPAEGVTRDAMAAFVARAIRTAEPGLLPESPPDAYADDDDSVHEHAVNQLAAAGVVAGTGGGGYSPRAVVSRGQMARLLANAAALVAGRPLPADRDLFRDDDGTPFEADINRVAQAGLTGGRADGRYEPLDPVGRDQMASFLARSLDLFVADGAGLTRPPAG